MIVALHVSLQQHQNRPPRYNWNIVESGIKHHTPSTLETRWTSFRECLQEALGGPSTILALIEIIQPKSQLY